MGSSERSFRLRGGDAWVAGAALAAAMIILVLLLAAPTGAQNAQAGEGPPAGTPAPGTNTNDDTTRDLATIAARNCRVSPGASVTLSDYDGTRARFVDGQQDIEITATENQIRIQGPPDESLEQNAVETFPDDSFINDGDWTVVTTTGISCQGTGTPADQQPTDGNAATDQYRAEAKEITVLVETIPDKKVLVDTGGPSLTMIGLLVLSLGFVGLGIVLLRRV